MKDVAPAGPRPRSAKMSAMCGVAGILDDGRVSADELGRRIRCMTSTLAHRGPDDAGVWVDPDAGMALGHRRLSIIDLSAEGRQPMESAGGRFVISYNGEIYNFKELRQRLQGSGLRFRGSSDTEVLVEAIAAWGVGRTVGLLNGMFAFAVWDRNERRLTLARDRMGEKPLYYGRIGSSFVFASELKAFRKHPGFCGDIDPVALAEYLRRDCVPAPRSIYQGIRKLPPGHVLEVSVAAPRLQAAEPYWSLAEVAAAGLADPLGGTAEEIVDRVESAISTSVRLRMVADVPVGAFLSGGIDSSLVVALMRRHSLTAPRTFTIGFDDPAYDESPHAGAIARHLETDHTELRVTTDDIVRAVQRMPATYDEPFADSSQVPTLLVAEMTRQHVTVSLSGDGGDELFAGYARYQLFNQRLWQATRRLPRSVRRKAGAALGSVPPAVWDRALALTGPVLPRSWHHSRAGDKVQKMARAFEHDSSRAAYSSLMCQWGEPGQILRSPSAGAVSLLPWLDTPATVVDQVMYCDQASYLPDDILAKLDRATMAVSLEARVPLLDHNLVELAWRVPLRYKLRGGSAKWALRQALARHVPLELFDRPKMGFGVPVGSWLRGSLRDWAEELLDAQRLADEGFFSTDVVRRLWADHLGDSGRSPAVGRLWSILMFQAWLDGSRLPAEA